MKLKEEKEKRNMLIHSTRREKEINKNLDVKIVIS